MSTTAASSSSSENYQFRTCRYDVFLSFRGSNTRKNFTDHLLKVLRQNGFYTFHDSMLNRGESIDSELLKAIEVSRMSIIIFSKNYADSKWCLDELVKIVYCRTYFQQIVLPVFLDVEPSAVRNQEGCFAEAFADHEEYMDQPRVQNWRKAMEEAGKLSGLHLQNDTNGYEAKLVDRIIEVVGKRLKKPFLNVAHYPVGIESRVLELMKLLCIEANDVRIIAIWGVSGIGKTTLAKAAYNCIFPKFEGSSFLAGIKDRSEKTSLQNQLISDLKMHKPSKINNIHQGVEEIIRMIGAQRVLLVLDDISNFEQLEMLAIDRQFFCPGSRVIITTKDKSCVRYLQKVAICSPEALNDVESLKLFSLYAFKEDHPHKGYEALSKEVVHYARGLPLVLQSLGTVMTSEVHKSEWRDNLNKLQKVPHDDIQGKLKVNFDSLNNDDKELFLNICCFFIGMGKGLMFKVMEDSNCFPIGIKTLVNRALVDIDGGVVSMHNSIRDMGREIVRQESLEEPGKRSRLWNHEEISEVFRQCSGTEAVESIIHGNYNHFEPLECVNVKVFENMPNLKMLLLHHVSLCGTYNQMPSFEKLKYLQWHGFPLEYMPSMLNMRNLVVMDMQSSRLKQLWDGTMSLGK